MNREASAVRSEQQICYEVLRGMSADDLVCGIIDQYPLETFTDRSFAEFLSYMRRQCPAVFGVLPDGSLEDYLFNLAARTRTLMPIVATNGSIEYRIRQDRLRTHVARLWSRARIDREQGGRAFSELASFYRERRYR